MTWGKASPYLIVAGIFDFLRAICEQSWLIAPALIAGATSSGLSGWLGATIAGVVGKVAGVVAAYFTTGALLLIGPLMGLAVGFLGWLAVLMMLLISNGRIFKENESSLLWMGAGFLVAEMPLIGTIPSISVSVWHLLHTQIKKDREVLKKWEKEAAALKQQEQEEILQRAIAMRAYAMSQDEAAKQAAQMATTRANDNREIPEQTLRAA